MPIFIGFGFYKLLPNKDFRCEILVGYAIETITSTIPMLSVQFNNNSSIVGSLTWLQVTALSLRIVSCLFFVIEVVIFAWESLITYKMRNTNIKRYSRLSDRQRVEKYGSRHAKIALVSIIAFTILVVIGALAIPGRKCPVDAEGEPQQFLSWGSCISCPKNCIRCSSAESCNSCAEGHYLS